LPASGGYLTNELIAKSDAFFLIKAVRWGYSCELKCLSDLLREADRPTHLLRKMAKNKRHYIHQLLPPAKILTMKRRHSHFFALPQNHLNLYKRRSFVLQNLFDDAS